jgi:hypothetical protein
MRLRCMMICWVASMGSRHEIALHDDLLGGIDGVSL